MGRAIVPAGKGPRMGGQEGATAERVEHYGSEYYAQWELQDRYNIDSLAPQGPFLTYSGSQNGLRCVT